MKIYIASSWKNESEVRLLADYLRGHDFMVDDFTDDSTGRYVFHWSELGDIERIDAKMFMGDVRTRKAFNQDRKMLDWADVIILLLPAGRSSHLEAGYMVGCGKPLLIYAPSGFVKGEFDVMYGFAECLCAGISELSHAIEGIERRWKR